MSAKNETIFELAQLAWDNGEAKKYGYTVTRQNDLVTLAYRQAVLSQFRVTGYETGIVEHVETKSKAQEIAVSSFVSYFKGEQSA